VRDVYRCINLIAYPRRVTENYIEIEKRLMFLTQLRTSHIAQVKQQLERTLFARLDGRPVLVISSKILNVSLQTDPHTYSTVAQDCSSLI
jgi:hypothetical protein